MCTVTYVPLSECDFILTSSRDVPFSREKADFPKEEENNDVKLWYPKDGKAGGTWIGASSKNRLICLLNGGFEYHTSRTNYRKSRGLIVKELLKSDDIKIALEEVNLVDIEQFTVVVVDWNDSLKLMEFVWDGSQKHLKEMPQEFHIWSSSTLYDAEVKKLRKDWFKDWQQKNDQSQESILEFHHKAGIGDPLIDVLMDRGMGGTVSITSIMKKEASLHWHYEDVRNSNVLPLKLQHKSQK